MSAIARLGVGPAQVRWLEVVGIPQLYVCLAKQLAAAYDALAAVRAREARGPRRVPPPRREHSAARDKQLGVVQRWHAKQTNRVLP